jgi:hypothetical protein
MTVVGECHLSTRPGLIYAGSSSMAGGGGGAVPIFVPNVVYSVYANATADTARNKTAAGCPTSWYDPLARPSSILEQIPLATMRLEGVVGNLPDSNLWTNLTETHIVAFYKQSTTVRDLIVEIVPLDSDFTTGTSLSTTVVSYLLLSSYRGTDGAFRLDDPFVGEAVKPYLTALKQYGGPFYSTLTGVINEIGAGPVVAPAPTSTTPAPTSNNAAVRLSSSSAAPTTTNGEPVANVASAIRTETIDTASSSSLSYTVGRFFVVLSAMALLCW